MEGNEPRIISFSCPLDSEGTKLPSIGRIGIRVLISQSLHNRAKHILQHPTLVTMYMYMVIRSDLPAGKRPTDPGQSWAPPTTHQRQVPAHH